MPNTTNFNWPTPADTDLVKDGAAAIRNLGDGVDTSLVDLKGGTTGQILSKASNADMDFAFITPNVGDLTEVQAGVGISVASGTGPIPIITNSSTDLITTAGDLLYGTAADTVARLGIGTANQVLAVNSGATAPEWVTPAASTPSFVGVSATKSASQSVANTTYTKITFDTEDFDTDAFHSTVTNTTRITIPAGKGGKYLFTGVFSFAANATGFRTMQLLKNNVLVNTVTRGPQLGGELVILPFSYVVDASVADYFEMNLYQDSGNALDCRVETVFQATYLGA